MLKDNGGPAYPSAANEWQHKISYDGMTLRDAFAMASLAPLIAGMYSSIKAGHYKMTEAQKLMTFAQVIAQEAYCQADAMLVEREME